MATSTKKSNYQLEIEKLLKGNNAEETANNISIQMKTAIEIQLSAQKGQELDLEAKLKKAKKNLDLMLMNNGQEVEDRSKTMENCLDAAYEVEQAEKDLAEQKKVYAWLLEWQAKVEK